MHRLRTSQTFVRLLLAAITVIAAAGVVLSAHLAQATTPNSVSVDTSHIGDASHFEFNGSSEWKYDIRKSPTGGVVMHIQGLKADAISKLRGLSDSLIKNVSIKENGVDGAAEVSFAVSSNADFFDYLTEAPSKLIIDFFPKDATSKDPEPKAAAKASTQPAKASVAKKDLKSSSRDDADDEEDDEAEPEKIAGAQKGAVRDISAVITGLPPKKSAAGNDKRHPAGADFIVVDQSQKPPTLAEEISARKDFSHGIFDGGDPEFQRFTVKDYEIKEEAVIASRANFYLPFPMLDLGNPQLKSLIDAPPSYEIVPNDTRENKDARIVLTLFSTGKRALFLTTAAEFLKNYPKSEYDEIVRYMVADTHEAMWRETNSSADFETAMGQYQLLTERYPQSPVTPRTLLYIGYAYTERGDSFGALKAFQRFLRVNPTSKHVDRVNIAIAEAYLKLNRFDDTYNSFDQLEKSAKSEKIREEAAFRKGNVFFRKRDWPQAIQNYKAAIAKYPAATPRFPNAYYNLAEAEFTQGHYREALEAYRAFLQKFPDHEHGGYAMTRMGELLGILGADPKRAQGAFLESFFRYRSTPGAGVARIRSLVARMPEMKDKELQASIREIKELTEKYSSHPQKLDAKAGEKAEQKAEQKEGEKPAEAKVAEGGEKPKKEGEGEKEGAKAKAEAREPASEETPRYTGLPERRPELPGIEEFTSLLLADGFSARGEFDRAVTDLVAYYQKNPQSPNKDRLTGRIVRNLTEGVRSAVDRGDFMDALRRWSKNSSGWFKNTDRVDVRFAVGRAYEQSGVYSEAANVYRDCLKRLSDIKGSGHEKERSVFETLPKADQLNLRLAATSAKEKDFASAESHLRNIATNQPALTEPEQIERAEISADVAEARGQADVARRYLTDLIGAWKGDPELTSPLHLRIAKLEGSKKNFKDADGHLSKIIEMRSSNGHVSDDVYAGALELKAQLSIARGKPQDAIKTYRDMIEQFDSKRPLSSVRYRLGQLLSDSGDFKGARATWSQLQPEKDGMWARMAAEQMQGAKWQNEYKKYINRIPAASDLRSSN